MPTTKLRKKGRKKPASERTIKELEASLLALPTQPAYTITKAISESTDRFKTGRYEVSPPRP